MQNEIKQLNLENDIIKQKNQFENDQKNSQIAKYKKDLQKQDAACRELKEKLLENQTLNNQLYKQI